MTEATISFADPAQIRVLFGARDQYLRQVQDSVGVNVVLRGDELRLHGDETQIQRGLEVFSELRSIVEQKGRLHESEVRRALGDRVEDAAGTGQTVADGTVADGSVADGTGTDGV
ncbi:MAG: hypothetical protein ACREJB_00310, partial [Planctomycetaceae bacterium]